MTKQVYSIAEFCSAFGISRATLYVLWNAGKGPRFFKIQDRRFISLEAADEWRRAREAEQERGAA